MQGSLMPSKLRKAASEHEVGCRIIGNSSTTCALLFLSLIVLCISTEVVFAQKESGAEAELVAELDHCPPASLHRTHPDMSQDSEFVYFSDVEVCVEGSVATILNVVKNIHPSRPLIFRWEKGDVGRTKFKPLDPGHRAENGWPIVSYDPLPDTDAPINYTQSYVPYAKAAVYREAKKSASIGEKFTSFFRTAYTSDSNEEISVNVTVVSFLSGNDVLNQVSVDPPFLTFAIGGLPDYLNRLSAEDKEYVRSTIFEQLSAQGVKATISSVSDLLNPQEFELQSDQIRKTGELLAFQVPSIEPIKFLMPSLMADSTQRTVANPTLSSFTGLLLDPNGFVVSSGRIALLLP